MQVNRTSEVAVTGGNQQESFRETESNEEKANFELGIFGPSLTIAPAV
jgi:hypothetical protein